MPIAFASTFLLHFLGVSVDVPGLAEIAREVLDVVCSAVGKAGVVTVVLLVGTSH